MRNRKIYDCFYFYDELDLLEIRLNILGDCVDHFVIVEADKSFNGLEREYVYEKNQDRFSKWKDKITYLKVRASFGYGGLFQKALDSPNTGNKEHWWIREFYIKEYLITFIEELDDNDIVYVSDIDEIWNPETCLFDPLFKVYRPIQKCYSFWLDNASNQGLGSFTGTRFSNVGVLKKYGPNHFRTDREVKPILIDNGGWHFSWLSRKADKWGDNHPDNKIRFNLAWNHVFHKDLCTLPPYLLENKAKWKELFLP